MLREENYLSDVVGIMRHLSVNRLNDAVFFTANCDLLLEILGAQGFKSSKDTLPTSLPVSQQIFLAGLRLDHKLHVAVAIWFFPVRVQKISPARKHIAGHVFHDHGNTV